MDRDSEQILENFLSPLALLGQRKSQMAVSERVKNGTKHSFPGPCSGRDQARPPWPGTQASRAPQFSMLLQTTSVCCS